MPKDAPAMKIAAARGFGGNVILFDRHKEDGKQVAADYKKKHGGELVPTCNHRDVIAGQGTVTYELLQEVGELDHLFICVAGGGLLSGGSLAAKELSPNCQIHGVEPLAGNDAALSLAAGKVITIPPPVTIADGACTLHIGEREFAIMQRNVSNIFTVTDE